MIDDDVDLTMLCAVSSWAMHCTSSSSSFLLSMNDVVMMYNRSMDVMCSIGRDDVQQQKHGCDVFNRT